MAKSYQVSFQVLNGSNVSNNCEVERVTSRVVCDAESYETPTTSEMNNSRSESESSSHGKRQNITNSQCLVCSSIASIGIHFGGPICGKCEAFFRNSLRDPVEYLLRPCITGKQKCPVTVNCYPCQFCRAKKCLSVGLNRNHMKPGQRPKNPNSLYPKEDIGVIDCEELVKRLKKAGTWGGFSKEKEKRIAYNTKVALSRKISNKWYAKYKAVSNNTGPRPLLPKVESQQPQVIVISLPVASADGKSLDEAQLGAIISSLSSGATINTCFAKSTTQQATVPITRAIGSFLQEAMSGVVEQMKRVRFGNNPPAVEFLVANNNAKPYLYNSSDRPVLEHWRRLEAHLNDLLCALVKFAKSLPQFDSLSGDDQHSLLSGTLLDMLFIAMLLFVDDSTKRLYLNSSCVYSLQYLCYVFSGCSGAGDFFRSTFDFCRRLSPFVVLSDGQISFERLGVLLALTLFSPPPAFSLHVEEKQKQFLNMLKTDISEELKSSASSSTCDSDVDNKLSALLACLSNLGVLVSKHRRMVKSVKDNSDIQLAVDLHAELLDLS